MIGSSEIIEKIFYAFGGDATHKIVYPAPSFSMYKIYAAASGAQDVVVPLQEDYSLDADAFIQTVNQNNASLAVLCNPNNPTGNVLSIETIDYIAGRIRCAFLIDEAYTEFCDQSAV